MDAMAISRSGLDVEWQRLQVIAANIANMNTTRTADGGAYAAQRLVSGPVQRLQGALRSGASPQGVMVYDIAQSNAGTRSVFNPEHPHADEAGYVTLPDISQAEEMSLMIRTQRAYEANLVALAAAQQMYQSALQVGRSA